MFVKFHENLVWDSNMDACKIRHRKLEINRKGCCQILYEFDKFVIPLCMRKLTKLLSKNFFFLNWWNDIEVWKQPEINDLQQRFIQII